MSLRDLDVPTLAAIVREHTPDAYVQYVDELERRWFQQWAQHALERLDVAQQLAAHHEEQRQSRTVIFHHGSARPVIFHLIFAAAAALYLLTAGRAHRCFAGRRVSRMVAEAGRVYPCSRGLVDGEHREWVLRRVPVSSVDVAERGRARVSASGDASGADVSGVAGVAS
jgi:hypothetical protein